MIEGPVTSRSGRQSRRHTPTPAPNADEHSRTAGLLHSGVHDPSCPVPASGSAGSGGATNTVAGRAHQVTQIDSVHTTWCHAAERPDIVTLMAALAMTSFATTIAALLVTDLIRRRR